jgi:iron(III) transport system ATP-binding protein
MLTVNDQSTDPRRVPGGSAIELRGLEKRFGGTTAVDGVDLAVPPGSFLVLLGPSGCGKTTILRMLAGLEDPTGGEILMGGQPVASGDRGTILSAKDRGAGLVFQSYALWPHMTVAGNVEWPLKVASMPKSERRTRVAEVLGLLGIADLGGRYPGEISGGQQQRVAIARMIAPKPGVLLFDEPLSNLDAKLRTEMRTELLRVHRATGATSVYVTHDQVEAMTMATHVAVMRAGRVEQFGAPEDLLASPASPFVASFVGTPPANLVRATVRDGRYAYGGVRLARGTGATGPALLMYRPEHLTLHDEPGEGRLLFEFAEATPVAGRVVVTGWAEGERLTVITDRIQHLSIGDRLYVEFPPEPDAVFGEDVSQDAARRSSAPTP